MLPPPSSLAVGGGVVVLVVVALQRALDARSPGVVGNGGLGFSCHRRGGGRVTTKAAAGEGARARRRRESSSRRRPWLPLLRRCLLRSRGCMMAAWMSTPCVR